MQHSSPGEKQLPESDTSYSRRVRLSFGAWGKARDQADWAVELRDAGGEEETVG